MIVHGRKDERNHLYFNRLSSKLSGTALIDYYRLKFILRRFFCVEHLMRTSKAKFEFSANHTCALNEAEPKAKAEFSAAGSVEHAT